VEIFSIGYALLSVQSALLQVVTPELRAVVVDICKEDWLFYIHFYYEGEASEKLIDLWECAITEASAALGPDCVLNAGVARLDYPQQIPLHGRFAYLREEPISLTGGLPGVASIISNEIIDFRDKVGVFISPVSEEKLDTTWGIVHTANGRRSIVPAKPPEYKIAIFPLAYALLALQRALLGVVTPDLRAVIADIRQEERLLYIRFYYDQDVSRETLEKWEYAITKSIADVGSDYLTDASIEKLVYPQTIPFCGRYAYLRKEDRHQ
jgi:hypothetical protein